jgi:hypothetical protein
MKAQLPDGSTVDLGTYAKRPDGSAYWQPNADLTAKQLEAVRHLLPADMVKQQERTIAGNRQLARQ